MGNYNCRWTFVTLQRGERVAQFSLHYPEDGVSSGIVDLQLKPVSGSAWFDQTVIRTLDNDPNIGKVVVTFEAGLAYAGASNLATLELRSTGFDSLPQAFNGEALVNVMSNIPGFEMTEGPEVLQFVDGRADLRTGFSRAVGDAKIRVTIDGQTLDSDPFVILDGDRASENVLDVSQDGVNGPVFVLHEVSDGDVEITVIDSPDGLRQRLTNVPQDARIMSVAPGGLFVYLGSSEFEIQCYEVIEGSLDHLWSRDLRNEVGLDDSGLCERLIYTDCGLVVVLSADAEGADLGEREFRILVIREDGVRGLWREEALAIDAQYESSAMELVAASVRLVNSRTRNEARFWSCIGDAFEEVGVFEPAPDTLGTRNLAAQLENGMLGRWGWLMDSSRADGTRVTGGNAGVYLDGSGGAMGYRDGWVGQFIQEDIGGSSRLVYEPGPKLFPSDTRGAYSLADGGVAVFHGEPGTLTLLPLNIFEKKASDVWVELIPNEDGKGPRDPETDRPLQFFRYGNHGPDRADSALIRGLDGTGWTDLDVGSLLPGQTGSFSIPFKGSDPTERVIAIIESATGDPYNDNNRAEGLLGVRLPPNGQILDEYLRSPELFVVSPMGSTVVGVFRDRFGQAELTTLALDSGEFVVEATLETESAFSALAIDDQKNVFAQEVGSSTIVEYAIIDGEYVSLHTYEGAARNAKLTPATIDESEGLVVVSGSDLFRITNGSIEAIRSPDDFVVTSVFATGEDVWAQGDVGSVRNFARVISTPEGFAVEPVWEAPGFQIGYHAFGNYVIDRTWRLNLKTGERIEHGIRDVVEWRRLLRYDELGRYAVAKKDGLSRRFGVNPWSTAEQEYPGGIRVLDPHEAVGRRIVGKSDRSGGGSLLLFESHLLSNEEEVDLQIDLIGSPEIVGVEGEFELVVELRNTGPGVAENVEAQFEASEEINWEIDESQGLTSLPARAHFGNLGPAESIRRIYRGSLGHGIDPRVVTIDALLLSSSMETDARRNRRSASFWRYPSMLSSRFELEGMDFEWTRPDRTEAIVTAMIRNRTTLFADVGEIPWESGPVLFRVNHSEFIAPIEPIESEILVENIEAGQLYEISWRVEIEEPGHRFFEVGWETGWISPRTQSLGGVYLDTNVSGVGVDQEFPRFASDAVVNFLSVGPELGIVTATSMSPLEFVALNPTTLERSNPYACCESDLSSDPAARLFEGVGDSIWLRRSFSKTIEELQPGQGIVRRIEHQDTPFALSQSIGAPNILATLSQVDSDIELGIYRDQDLIDERRWSFGSTDQSLTFLSPDRLLVTMGASVALLGIHASEVMELDRVPTGIPFSNLQSTRDSVFAIPPSRIRVDNDQLTIEDLVFPPNRSTFVGENHWFALDKSSESLAAYDLETNQVVWWKSLAPLDMGAAEVQRVGMVVSGEDERLVVSAAIDGSSFLTSTSLDSLEDYVPKLEMGESSDNFEFVLNGSGKLSLWVSLNRGDYLHGAALEFSTSDELIQFRNDSGEFVDRLRVPIDWSRDWQSYQIDYKAVAEGSGSVEARFVVNSASSDRSRYGIARWPITVFGAPRVRVTDLTYTEGEGLDTFWSLSHAPRVDHELSARVVATSEDARSFSVGQEIPLLIRRGSQDYQPSFPIHDDRILQAPATVEFEIQSNDAALSSNRFQLTILDNDLRSFRIVNDGNVEVDLQESAFSVWVVLDDSAPYPVRVRLRTVDGSASSGVDYVGFEKWLRIPPGRLAVKAEIPIVPDLQYEGGQENLYIELMEVENLRPGAIEEEFIIEDPKLVIQLEPSDGLGAVATFDSLIGLRYQAEIRSGLSKDVSWMPLGDALTGDGSRLRVNGWAQEGDSQTFLRIWAFPTSGDE